MNEGSKSFDVEAAVTDRYSGAAKASEASLCCPVRYNPKFLEVIPHVLVPLEDAPPFPCSSGALVREPRETKGAEYRVTTDVTSSTCSPEGDKDGGCC
jgi:hypothetical protein